MPNLYDQPIHLGLGATAVPQSPFTGLEWYEAYAARHAADGAEGRLVSLYRFAENWTSWEMHPAGEEVVVCLSGAMTIYQEHADGRIEQVELGPSDYAINPPGTWHTADVTEATTALFITPGAGTSHRPR